jgi:CubicO group peptidase (beta-lactamase class C family)
MLAVPLVAGDPARATEPRLGPPPNAALSQQKLSRIDDFFHREIAAGNLPGAVVQVQRHGKPVYFKSFGNRDAGVAMTPDAIFPLHSVTKTITSVATMMLVDSGKLSLDDPVSKYIPSFSHQMVAEEEKDDAGNPVLKMVPPQRPVAIRDLLLHTSGITYGFYGDALVKSLYLDLYLGDFNNAQFAERIASVPLAGQPGTLWDYGHSTDVLGRVIEVVTGQSLYQFEKTALLDPLGMTTTKYFLTDPAERARFAPPPPKERRKERNALDVTRWESGGGGLVSTVGDFARFAQMLLNGGTFDGRRYLSPTTYAAMMTDQIGASSGVARDYYYFPGDGFGFGYGFGIRTDPGKAVPPPPGSLGEIKWDGASGVYFVIDRAQDMFILLMQNAPTDHVRVQAELKKVVYDAFEE